MSIKNRDNNKRKVVVESLTLNTLMNKNKIQKFDIIKYDIEGAEDLFLTQYDLKNKTIQLVGEVHYDLSSFDIKTVLDNLNLKNKQVKKINENREIVYGII